MSSIVQSLEKRVAGIDLLRGLCIIAVVLHHINIRIRLDKAPLGALLGGRTGGVLFWSGYYGVRVFFVISGFLIAGWSLKRWGTLDKLNVRQFYSMRFARIVPCLIGLLLLLSILHLAGAPRFVINRPHQSLGGALFAALTFHSNWLEARTGYLPAAWDVLWSLSVEEVFYLAFPLLCRILRKQVLLILVLFGFVVVGPIARVLVPDGIWADYQYLGCMDGIALGCLAAIVANKFKFSSKMLLGISITGAILCLLIEVFRGNIPARLGLYQTGLDVTVLSLGTALLVIAFQQRSESKPVKGHWWTGWLRWFGRNSYEVYLTHMLVIWPIVGIYYRLHQSINVAPWWFIATTALTGLLGYAVARWYSEPLNKSLRRKLLPQKIQSAQSAATSS